jgi:hypothetical protein
MPIPFSKTFDCVGCGMRCNTAVYVARTSAARVEDRVKSCFCSVCWPNHRLAELEDRLESLITDFGKWRREK